MPPTLGIIADDLSGAGDAGLQFAKLGRRTVVLLDSPTAGTAAGVLALDTDSRQSPPDEAAARVRSACRALLGLGVGLIYKKIDSTLRGNLGAELAALLDERPGAVALVCPAYLAAGRTVAGGLLLVGGTPLASTEFAGDPLWPARESRVAAVLERQLGQPVSEVGLEAVRGGSGGLAARVEELRARGAAVCAVDAETVADLAVVARVVVESGGRSIGVGSAGLAEQVALALDRAAASPSGGEIPPPPPPAPLPRGAGASRREWSEARAHPAAFRPGGPTLVVVGSANPVARAQLATLVQGRGTPRVALTIEALLAGDAAAAAEVARALGELRAPLREGRDAALSLDAQGDDAAWLGRTGSGPTRDAASARLTAALAAVVAALSSDESGGLALGGLAVTGGETAKGVCRALGAAGLLVEREVRPGVPQSRLLGGASDGLPIVTKAGGFGEREALLEAVGFLRHLGLERSVT